MATDVSFNSALPSTTTVLPTISKGIANSWSFTLIITVVPSSFFNLAQQPIAWHTSTTLPWIFPSYLLSVIFFSRSLTLIGVTPASEYLPYTTPGFADSASCAFTITIADKATSRENNFFIILKI